MAVRRLVGIRSLDEALECGFGPCPRKADDFVEVRYVGIGRGGAGRDVANGGDAGGSGFLAVRD